MSNIGGPESVGTLHYTWAGGYHINGAKSDILEARVLPALDKLSKGSVVADFGCGEGRLRTKAPHHTLRPYIFRGFEINSTAVDRYNQGSDSTPDRAVVADITQLNVGRDRYHAGLFWRVLHGFSPELHEKILRQIAATLRIGASLHVTARSKRDWIVADLLQKGLYKEGQVNDAYPAMQEALDPEGITSWPLYFFQPGEVARLGERVGLVVVHQQVVQENSGYEILAKTRPSLSYDYIEFRKV